MYSGSCHAILSRLTLFGVLCSPGCSSGGADYALQLRPVVAPNQSPFDGLDSIDLVLEHQDGSTTRHQLSGISGSPTLGDLGVLEGTRIRLEGISGSQVVATGRTGPISLSTGTQDQNILVANVDDLAWLATHSDGFFLPGLVSVGEGRFLVFGGLALNSPSGEGRRGKQVYALELADPSDPLSLEELGEMPTYAKGLDGEDGTTRSRHGHTAMLLSSGPHSGKVLVAGGTSKVFHSPDITATGFLYDPETGEVQELSESEQMTKAHYLHNTVVDALGNVVVLGGWGQTDAGFVTILHEFDFFSASTGQFDQSAKNRTLFGGGAYGMAAPLGNAGVVHCGGGMISQGNTWKAVSACSLITTSGEISSEIPDMPVALSHGSMLALSSSELLVFGGVQVPELRDIGAAVQASNVVLHYDNLSQIWTELDELQLSRANAAVELLPDGRVLILGGRQSADLFFYDLTLEDEVLACLEIYDPFVALNQPTKEASTLLSGCSASQSTNLLPTRAHSIVTAQDPDHGIVALGGLSSDGSQPSVSLWQFAPSND
jgi:hypothetical protein